MRNEDGEPKELDDVEYEFVWEESAVSLLFFPSYKLTDAWVYQVDPM